MNFTKFTGLKFNGIAKHCGAGVAACGAAPGPSGTPPLWVLGLTVSRVWDTCAVRGDAVCV